jgi:hypothetical protein
MRTPHIKVPFRSIFIDLLFLAGLSLIASGVYRISKPAGLIAAGVFTVVIASVSGPRKGKHQS